MPANKNIRDLFDNTSLENEDWLTPSDSIFSAVEEEIYTGKNKKNRRAFWFPFIGVFTLVFAVSLYFIQNISLNNSEVSAIDTPLNSNNKTFQDPNATQNLESSERSFNAMKKEDETISASSNQISYFTESKENPNAAILSSVSKSIYKTDEKVVVQEFVKDNQLITAQDEIPLSVEHALKKEDNVRLGPASNDDAINLNSVKVQTISQPSLAQFAMLPLLKLNGIDFQSTDLDINSQLVQPKKISLPWYIDFSVGQSNWNFNLNENYRTLLQPADFSFSDGNGAVYSLGLTKAFSERFKLSFSANYESINFNSGHNSSIDYVLSNEGSDSQNEINLTMATPVGLIQSNLIIDRLSNDVVSDTTRFIVDLSNTHRLQQIGFDLSVSSEIFKMNRLSLEVTSGLALSYLSMINNSNESSLIEHDDFHSMPGKIVSNQDNIRSWRPSIVYGANLNYNLDKQHIIGAKILRKSDLNAIFKLDDFSTLLHRQHIQIYLRKRI